MRITKLSLLLAITLLVPCLYGQDGDSTECAGSIAIQALPGDTYIALFGPAWQQVANCNPQTFIRNGVPVTSPDLLAAGAMIRIPEGTPLTPAVTERLQTLERQRTELMDRLNALENAALDDGDRTAMSQIRDLLNNRIRFASDTDYAKRQIEYLESAVRTAPAADAADEPWWQSRPVIAGVLLVLGLLMLVIWMAQPKAGAVLKERQVRADLRLTEACARAGIRYKP